MFHLKALIIIIIITIIIIMIIMLIITNDIIIIIIIKGLSEKGNVERISDERGSSPDYSVNYHYTIVT